MKHTPTDSTEPPLPTTVEACHVVIRESWSLIQEMRQRLQVLEEQTKLDSRTSSKPPSSDGPGRGSRQSKPKSGRKVGGQPGHKGSFRAMVPPAQVDHQVLCRLEPDCARCHGVVVVDEERSIRRQVFDLPPITAQVTEYLRLRGGCSGCGHKQHADLPTGVPSGQLGARALALVGTLSGQFHLTQGKIQRLLEEVMGLQFSIGTISMAHGQLTQAKALLGEQPQGVIVSDRYAGYNFIDLQQRQVCWAHMLRDFSRMVTREGIAGAIGKRLQACGYALFRWREQGKPAEHFAWLQQRIGQHLRQLAQDRTGPVALPQESGRPPDQQRRRAGGARFRHQAQALVLHPIGTGLRFLERISSTVQTRALQGRQTFGYLEEVMTAWLARKAVPSLVPDHVRAPGGLRLTPHAYALWGAE